MKKNESAEDYAVRIIPVPEPGTRYQRVATGQQRRALIRELKARKVRKKKPAPNAETFETKMDDLGESPDF